MAQCPCGSELNYASCCGRFIDEGVPAATAEELMRARYTAYTTGNVEFIMESHDPDSRDTVSEDATRDWSQDAHWLGLQVVKTSEGEKKDTQGQVEFIASFEIEGQRVDHHERALFRKNQGHWYFVDGQIVHETYVRNEPKVGRNDPCPCNSGRKYKHCCGR